jgi:formate dehydrogenase subunit delta
METEHMVHNANQIALYFAAYPKEEAVASVADHIKKFWEHRMRQQLDTYVAQGGAGLHALVLEAVKRLNATTGQPVRK